MDDVSVGARLRSAVCTTEVIVVRAPGGPLDLRCGGHPLLPADATPANGAAPQPGLDSGSALGKRYSDDEAGIEVLVTKPGAGALSIGDEPLPVKDPKRLPTSD